jgi:branched-chain amino acid transport system permease protein
MHALAAAWGSGFDNTVNGLIIGNIYALLAVGLALIFGVSHLINFAHGSVYTVGAYVGWACGAYLHTPLPVTMLIVIVACGGLGMAIERIGLRPLAGSARIAPLLATIGISFVLDQLVQLIASPDPRAVPSGLPDWRITVGSSPGSAWRRRGCSGISCASPSSAGRCARPPRTARRRCRWASTRTA